MTNKRTKSPMPFYLVALPRTDKNIYNTTNIIGLSITIENLKTTGQLAQWYRCQEFGHTQSLCTAPIKCVVRGERHQCVLTKEKDKLACGNCGESNVASYRKCPKAPKILSLTHSENSRNSATYANVAKPHNNQAKSSTKTSDKP